AQTHTRLKISSNPATQTSPIRINSGRDSEGPIQITAIAHANQTRTALASGYFSARALMTRYFIVPDSIRTWETRRPKKKMGYGSLLGVSILVGDPFSQQSVPTNKHSH